MKPVFGADSPCPRKIFFGRPSEYMEDVMSKQCEFCGKKPQTATM